MLFTIKFKCHPFTCDMRQIPKRYALILKINYLVSRFSTKNAPKLLFSSFVITSKHHEGLNIDDVSIKIAFNSHH